MREPGCLDAGPVDPCETPELNIQRETPELNIQRETPELNIQRETPELNIQRETPELNIQRKTPELTIQREAFCPLCGMTMCGRSMKAGTLPVQF
ncbi:hypothetical protein ESCO_006870 [Escovopsis weberi]|uniref:Uncharacterized protein n=1 Tax=Escovopsis weberi TaxID=150374 RepID=A0A0M8MYC2_ESCWE|nr:hypothetical protein ESCO_006870 [Escovopsis weberi]